MNRSGPEWSVFAAASLVLLLVTGIIVAQWVAGSDGPAVIDVTVRQVTQVSDRSWQVDAVATNIGDETAAQVEVVGELTRPDGTSERSTQTVDFLSPDEQANLVFVFSTDPAAGQLEVRPASFSVP